MIGKAMAATIAATMLLGGATVMADEYIPVVPPLNAQETENQTPGQTILRDESKNELERMIQEILDQAAQDATTPVQKPAEIDEPEAELTLEILGLDEEDEEADDALFHTGDIIHVGSEPVTLPEGSYKVFVDGRNALSFINPTFTMRGRNLLVSNRGLSLQIGSGFTGLRVVIDRNGNIELHPVTQVEINYYESRFQPDEQPSIEVLDDDTTPDDQVPSVPEVIESPEVPETPVAPEVPATPATSETPATPAAPASSVAAPAVSAPAASTQVAGAARLVAEGGVEGFVNRLYTVALGREADPTGYAYWVEMLNSKQMTATEVADGFFNSPEFAARDLNNVEYLTVLYSVFFNREPDHNGLNHWVSYLQNGLLTREQVIEGFTNSREWINTCDIFGVEV